MSEPVVVYTEPATIAVVNLAQVAGFDPEGYVGTVLATGSTAAEAYDAISVRALRMAQESHARHVQLRDDAVGQRYALLGLRFTAGVTSSGQPEWLAYGTLARGIRRPG